MSPARVTKPPTCYRILVVDDHPMVRERLAEVIAREPDLQLCAAAEDRREAIAAAEKHFPDLAIVDITLKNSDGLELIKDLQARWPRLRILVVSMHDESLYAQRVIRAGAMGYITKQEATRNIILAIRTVIRGGIYLNSEVSARIISRFALRRLQNVNPIDLLGDRELQVFELVGQGHTTRQIADRLNIGVRTVETYRRRIREKLGHLDRSRALRTAVQ